jgi:hypothetical protein
MKDLTKTQIATFANFRNLVEKSLIENTTALKGSINRAVSTKEGLSFFLDLMIQTSRQSKLNPVLNSLTVFEKTGVTKSNIQKRNFQTKALVFQNGKPAYVFAPRCARMYTTEAYREMRAKATGGLAAEPIFVLSWKAVPSDIQERLTRQFPRKNEKVTFSPVSIGVVVKKGNKPVKGEQRHQWSRLQFVVLAKYNDQPVVLPELIVWDNETHDGETVIQRLGKVIGAPESAIPYWPEEAEVAQAQELELAANSQVADQNAFDFSF